MFFLIEYEHQLWLTKVVMESLPDVSVIYSDSVGTVFLRSQLDSGTDLGGFNLCSLLPRNYASIGIFYKCLPNVVMHVVLSEVHVQLLQTICIVCGMSGPSFFNHFSCLKD